ncbi:MAG: hypothetical protein WB630_18450, partial [Candidatus Acidiferrales bacterium]
MSKRRGEVNFYTRRQGVVRDSSSSVSLHDDKPEFPFGSRKRQHSPDGHFQNPEIPIAHGTEIIKGRSLVNDRTICPNGAFPTTEIQERVPESETVRTLRTS